MYARIYDGSTPRRIYVCTYDYSRFLTLIVYTFVCIYAYICMYAYTYVFMYYVCMCRNNAGRVYSHALEAGIQVVESDLTQADSVFSLVPPRTNPQCMYVCMYVCGMVLCHRYHIHIFMHARVYLCISYACMFINYVGLFCSHLRL